jgi:hypothetical protein
LLLLLTYHTSARRQTVTCEMNYLDSDTVKVEHMFTFNVSEKWEKPLKKVVDSWLDLSYQWADSFRIIGVGIAGYLFLIGTARLVDSIKAKPSPKESKKEKSSSSSSSSKSKMTSKESSAKESPPKE